jgi:hypothetical protein
MVKNNIAIRLLNSRCLLLLAILAVTSVHAEEQIIWDVKNIGAPINSSNDEGFPAITRNGLALYFARNVLQVVNGHESNDWNIYVSTRSSMDAPWGEPRALPDHINTAGSEHSVSFSPDGRWLYFSSSQLDTCGGLDIFRSYREDLSDELAWDTPQNLGCDVNTKRHDVCVIYHTEEQTNAVSLYFVSNRQGPSDDMGAMDAWRVGFDPESDTYSNAELIAAVSSPKFDGHLDPEAGYVWTEREGGYGGSDLWHSARDEQGNWLTPVNLGPGINTEYEEQLPAPYDNGRLIYFPSDRPGGNGGLDIYVAEKTAPKAGGD